MPTIDNVDTQDEYSNECTISLRAPGRGGFYTITDADVYVQIQSGAPGSQGWGVEHPGFAAAAMNTVEAGATGIRFRSRVKGRPATVSAVIFEAHERAGLPASWGGFASTSVLGVQAPYRRFPIAAAIDAVIPNEPDFSGPVYAIPGAPFDIKQDRSVALAAVPIGGDVTVLYTFDFLDDPALAPSQLQFTIPEFNDVGDADQFWNLIRVQGNRLVSVQMIADAPGVTLNYVLSGSQLDPLAKGAGDCPIRFNIHNGATGAVCRGWFDLRASGFNPDTGRSLDVVSENDGQIQGLRNLRLLAALDGSLAVGGTATVNSGVATHILSAGDVQITSGTAFPGVEGVNLNLNPANANMVGFLGFGPGSAGGFDWSNGRSSINNDRIIQKLMNPITFADGLEWVLTDATGIIDLLKVDIDGQATQQFRKVLKQNVVQDHLGQNLHQLLEDGTIVDTLRTAGASYSLNDHLGNPLVQAQDTGRKIGVFGAAPVAQPTVTGSRGGNAALASLLTALASEGWIVDGTTP